MKKIGATHDNLDQQVYQMLKKMIETRELVPGEKIPQEKLASDLGISRTPLISALKYLEQDKLVESIPRRGFFVRMFSSEEMIAIFELREVLEGLAARRAALCITDSQSEVLKRFFRSFQDHATELDTKAYAREDRRFHNFIVNISAQEFLRSILHTYNIIAFSYQTNTDEGLLRPPDQTIEEHLAIIDAITGRKAQLAEELMRLHLKESIDYYRTEIGSPICDAGVENTQQQGVGGAR